MPTVLIATEKPFAPDARDAAVRIMGEGGLAVKVLEGYKIKQDLIVALQGVEGVIVRSDKIDREVLDAVSGLELVVRAGAGYDNIDFGYAEQKGVYVENTPGQNKNAVAELALQLMLRSVRPLDGGTGGELKGKRLGILGFGNVGGNIAEWVNRQMDVVVYDKFLDKRKANECGVGVASSVEELFSDADFISLNIPSTEETRGSVGYDLMKRMKKEGVLVNTARDSIIDEKDLIRILEERPKFRYVTDVAPSDETMMIIKEKFSDRVIVTLKKQGAQTREANYNAATAAATQCVDGLIHRRFYNEVNNPLPGEMKDYTTLAQYLGVFNRAFVAKPNRVEVTCHGGLNKYEGQLGRYVLKGLFQDELGKDLTPSEASKAAEERGIELVFRKPNGREGHGDSIEVEYMRDGEFHSVRGRIDEKELQINRTGDFGITVPIVPGVYVVAQYEERAGMADMIGNALSSKGYNKIDGGFRQDLTGKSAMTFYRMMGNGDILEQIREIVEKDIKTMPGVYRALTVNIE